MCSDTIGTQGGGGCLCVCVFLCVCRICVVFVCMFLNCLSQWCIGVVYCVWVNLRGVLYNCGHKKILCVCMERRSHGDLCIAL